MQQVKTTPLIISAFILAWLGFLPEILTSYGYEIPAYVSILKIFMVISPIGTAVFFTYKAGGKASVKSLFKRFTYIKAPLGVLFVSLVLPVIILFAASLIGLTWANEPWPSRYDAGTIIQNIGLFLLMYLILNTEEILWRGVVFQQWCEQYGFLQANLRLAPIWWLFHMPYFLANGGHQAGYGMIEFTMLVIPSTFILGWIYQKSIGSLFHAHLFHQLLNGVGQALPLFPVFIGGILNPVWVLDIQLTLVAIVILMSYLKRNFSNG